MKVPTPSPSYQLSKYMKKDDTGAYTKAAFALLAVISFAVLLFSLKRLYDHIRSTKHYTPLILFYSVLSSFLVSK